MTLARLKNSELVESVFGRWPSFHDAEISKLVLDRIGPTLWMEMVAILPLNLPEGGRLNKFYDLSFRFDKVDSLELSEFNHQNVLFSITLSAITEERLSVDAVQDRVKVDLEPTFGIGGSFTCSGGEVLAIDEKRDVK